MPFASIATPSSDRLHHCSCVRHRSPQSFWPRSPPLSPSSSLPLLGLLCSPSSSSSSSSDDDNNRQCLFFLLFLLPSVAVTPSPRRCQRHASPAPSPSPSPSPSQSYGSSPHWRCRHPAPDDLHPRQPLPPPLLILLAPAACRPPCYPACLRPHRSPEFLSSRFHRSDRSAPFRCRREDVPSSLIQSRRHRRRCWAHHPTRARRASRLWCPLRRWRRPPPTPPPPLPSTLFDF